MENVEIWLYAVAPRDDKSQKQSMARDPKAPVDFRDWAEVLARSELPVGQKAAYGMAVIHYLGWCKRRHTPASVASAQLHIAETDHEDGRAHGPVREALRWFLRSAFAREAAPARVPPPRVDRVVRDAAVAREIPPLAPKDRVEGLRPHAA